MSVPSQIAAGATLAFTETLSGYPPADFTLAFILNRNGVFVINIAGVTSGAGFVIAATADQTKNWTPGQYNFAELVTETDGGAVTQARAGVLSVTPNFAISTPLTEAQKQLANLDAAIAKICKSPNAKVEANGQTYERWNLKDAFDARDRLQAQVDGELRAAGLSTKGGARRIATRFA